MAKDKTGFMARTLSDAPNPVAPDFGLIEQAGASRGRAAEIEGKRKAETIDTVTAVGKAAYEGYVESEASNLAAKVTEGLNTPTFVGPVAESYNRESAPLIKKLEEARAAGRLIGEPTPELLQEWNDRALQITRAAAGKVFSQREAQSRLATEMRELIGKHPSQASRIREVYNAYTGVSDWNTREIEGALTAKAAEDEAAKRRARLLEADAKKITESGIASRFGMRNTEEVYRHIAEGTDDGVRMYSAMAAANLTEQANVSLTKGDMNVAYNNAIVSATSRFAEVTQAVSTKLAQQDIDIDNIGALTPQKEGAIQAAFLEAKSAERKALEGALTIVRDRAAREPTMDAATVNNTIKMLEDRLAVPATKDLGEMLNQLRLATTSRLQTAQTAQTALSVVEAGMNSAWGKEMVAKMKDPRIRKQIMADYPTNQFVQELGRQLEGGQSAYSATMDRMQRIADALLNPGGSASNAATLSDATKTPQGVKETADTIALIKTSGVDALNNYSPTSETGSKSVVVTAQHFVMSDKEWPSMFRSVMGDTYKNVLKNTPERIVEFEQSFKGRSERLLTDTIPKEIRTVMARLPDNKLIIRNGVIGLEKDPTTVDEVQAQIQLSSILYKTNQLLAAHAKISGTSMAEKFVNTITPPEKRIPASALKGSVSSVPTKPISSTVIERPIVEGDDAVPKNTLRLDELSMSEEMKAEYDRQTTVRGKVEVLQKAGVDDATIEALVRRPIADIKSGKADYWWEQ